MHALQIGGTKNSIIYGYYYDYESLTKVVLTICRLQLSPQELGSTVQGAEQTAIIGVATTCLVEAHGLCPRVHLIP